MAVNRRRTPLAPTLSRLPLNTKHVQLCATADMWDPVVIKGRHLVKREGGNSTVVVAFITLFAFNFIPTALQRLRPLTIYTLCGVNQFVFSQENAHMYA